MKTKSTELIFILDRSGSMSGLEKETISGFNTLLQKQKEAEGQCRITTVLFDHEYTLLHDRLELAAVSPLTSDDYQVRGYTALIDAIGKSIGKIDAVQKHTAAKFRADQVMFVIMTDGMENASREFSAADVKRQIEFKKADEGWEFLFLGANIDAVETAAQLGIGADRAENFHADAPGLQKNYTALSDAIAHVRSGRALEGDWSDSIKADFASRKPRKKTD